jgi:hypothetical protein
MKKTRKQHGIMAIVAIIAIGFALAACDDGKNDNPAEEPEYRTDTITFAFKDGEGNPVDGTFKAEVQGTMLLADWNNAKTAIHSKIETAQHNASNRSERIDFNFTFNADNQNIIIIFTANVNNGKLEVKDGEWNKLYVNPTALDSITEAEIKTAAATMRAGLAP